MRLADPQVSAGVYNVCDNHPPTQRELYGWISEFLGKTMPPDGPVDPHRKRGLNNKRVSNQKLRSIGWSPEFPSFREALPSLVRDGF
jgi:hypothetical protein